MCPCTTHTCRVWEQAVKQEAEWSTSCCVVFIWECDKLRSQMVWFSACLRVQLHYSSLSWSKLLVTTSGTSIKTQTLDILWDSVPAGPVSACRETIDTLRAYSVRWNIQNIAGRNLSRQPNMTLGSHDSSSCDIFTWTFRISPTNHRLISCCWHGQRHVFITLWTSVRLG